MNYKPKPTLIQAAQRRTLIVLAMEYREKAKNEKNPVLKDIYWDMAFQYLADYRHYYGGKIL